VVVLDEFEGPIAEPKWPTHILLVDADPNALRRVGAGLSSKGYRVATASSFEEARKRFDAVNPELVVAAVRLEAFNGLHLAAWVRFNHADVPIIITHTAHDAVLEADAARVGARFVVEPLKDPQFWQYVCWAVGDPHLHEAHAVSPRSGGA
jgi:DNA-binding response OmpR family regulator